jgi:hypothetical protein
MIGRLVIDESKFVPNFRHPSNIWLKELRKIKKNFSQGNQDLNLGSPENKIGVLTTCL